MSDTSVIEVGRQGRVVIPAEIRRKLGIEPGTKLAAMIKDGALVLVPREVLMTRLQARFAGLDRSMSEELLAERRAEAAAEAAAEGWEV